MKKEKCQHSEYVQDLINDDNFVDVYVGVNNKWPEKELVIKTMLSGRDKVFYYNSYSRYSGHVTDWAPSLRSAKREVSSYMPPMSRTRWVKVK